MTTLLMVVEEKITVIVGLLMRASTQRDQFKSVVDRPYKFTSLLDFLIWESCLVNEIVSIFVYIAKERRKPSSQLPRPTTRVHRWLGFSLRISSTSAPLHCPPPTLCGTSARQPREHRNGTPAGKRVCLPQVQAPPIKSPQQRTCGSCSRIPAARSAAPQQWLKDHIYSDSTKTPSKSAQGDTSAIMIPRSDPKEKRVNTVEAKGNELISSETNKPPRGRPRKIPKQTNETTSECTKSSDMEITPIETGSDEEVKKELDTETGKQLSKENAPEDNNELEKKKQKSVESLVFEKKLPDVRTSNCSQGDTSAIMIPRSDPKEKRANTVEAKGNELISSETTKRPRGRPRKIPKQTNETTSECTKSSDKEITPIETGSDEEVKKELDTETGERMSKENTPEDNNEMEKHATTIPEVDDKSDLARSISSWRKGSPVPVTDVEMSEQENGDPAEDSAKPTSSAVQKFYMRRNSNQSFKKEC